MQNGNLDGVCKRLANVLRDVTVVKHPIIAEIEEFLKENGACGALMSGSGPSVFGIFDDANKCACAIEATQKKYNDMFVQKAEFII